jgi:hypothetical protein
MRLYEIFPIYVAMFLEDGLDAVKQADHAILTAKRQKKTAEISNLRDKTADKQRELTSMSSAMKPIKPIQPIKPKGPK